MNLHKNTSLVLALLFCLCSPGLSLSEAASPDKIKVFTSLAPVSFVVEEIGRDLVDVQTLIPVGRDPHTFSPTPRQVVALGKAQLYFTVDMSFEKELLGRLAAGYSKLHVADCSIGIAKRQMNHDHHHHHQNGEGDPHIWLGVDPLTKMAENIAVNLAQIVPEFQTQFQENLSLFLNSLNQLENNLRLTLKPYQGRSFLVFHPSFGYFAESFNLVQQAVEIEGKSPSPRQLTNIIRMAKSQKIKVIFVQPQFDKRAATRIAQAIEGEVLTMDPLAANVFENLREMAEKIASALSK